MIVSDTLRYDHLGFYGNKNIKTPNLDRLAQRSVIFDNCYAGSFPTIPARADIFTGRWTYTYFDWLPLSPNEIILAQVLEESGYKTKAVVDTPYFIREGYGYDRGFQDFEWIRGQDKSDRDDLKMQRRYETDYFAPSTMLAASRWLERNYKKKFFLYVDTWDPHEPWDPPRWYAELYHKDYDGKVVNPCYWLWRERGITEEDLEIGHACYCGEITMVDRWVGHLLDSLEYQNLMDDTVIVFTSDHGFYFGEHEMFGKAMIEFRGKNRKDERGWKWHRSPLYEEITRVPLLVYVPGVKPRKSDALVTLADIMPTILKLTGTTIPRTVQSRSLVPLIEGKDEEGWDFVVTSFPLYIEGSVSRIVDGKEREVIVPLPSTITTKEWTLIYSCEGQLAELYHLPSDPKQEKNLIHEEPEVASELLKKFVFRLEEANTEPQKLKIRRRF